MSADTSAAGRPGERGQDPGQALGDLVGALNAGRLEDATGLFAREGCLVTPDATVICGRAEIRAALAQLVGGGFHARLDLRTSLVFAGVALVSDRWTTTVAGAGGTLRQATRGMSLLTRDERRWAVLLLAPWGWAIEPSPSLPVLLGDR